MLFMAIITGFSYAEVSDLVDIYRSGFLARPHQVFS